MNTFTEIGPANGTRRIGREHGDRIGQFVVIAHFRAEGSRDHRRLLGLGHVIEAYTVFAAQFPHRLQPADACLLAHPAIGLLREIESRHDAVAVEFLGILPADAPDIADFS